MKIVEGLWESYREQVVPLGALPTQVIECKRAFYAGVKGLFDFIGENINNTSSGPTESNIATIMAINEELEEFCESVIKGIN